jgi:hypothetical protein
MRGSFGYTCCTSQDFCLASKPELTFHLNRTAELEGNYLLLTGIVFIVTRLGPWERTIHTFPLGDRQVNQDCRTYGTHVGYWFVSSYPQHSDKRSPWTEISSLAALEIEETISILGSLFRGETSFQCMLCIVSNAQSGQTGIPFPSCRQKHCPDCTWSAYRLGLLVCIFTQIMQEQWEIGGSWKLFLGWLGKGWDFQGFVCPEFVLEWKRWVVRILIVVAIDCGYRDLLPSL